MVARCQAIFARRIGKLGRQIGQRPSDKKAKRLLGMHADGLSYRLQRGFEQEHGYGHCWTEQRGALNVFLPAGTKVRYDWGGSGPSEFGVVAHCWMSEEIGTYDCYVAFFGDEFPSGPPKWTPYVLRYAAQSLNVVSE